MLQRATIVCDDIFERNAIVAISGVAVRLLHGGYAWRSPRRGAPAGIRLTGSEIDSVPIADTLTRY
jgi:hypothetical protein